MRLLSSLTLTTLTLAGLIIAPPAFNDASAATIQAKPAQKAHAGLPKRRAARSSCPARMVPTGMYYLGQRVCVDPHGTYRYHLDNDLNVVYD